MLSSQYPSAGPSPALGLPAHAPGQPGQTLALLKGAWAVLHSASDWSAAASATDEEPNGSFGKALGFGSLHAALGRTGASEPPGVHLMFD